MYLELANGKDTFRAQGGSSRRNVNIFLHVLPYGYGGVLPIHVAYQNKVKGTGDKKLLSVVPASSRFAESPGQWYNTRYEMMPRSVVIVERRDADPVKTFDVSTTYAVLIASENAPLHTLVAPLPSHILADVDAVFFKGRFYVVDGPRTLDYLDEDQLQFLCNFFSVEDAEDVAIVAGSEQWEGAFNLQVLEKGVDVAPKVVQPQRTIKGRNVVSIRRTRRIKT